MSRQELHAFNYVNRPYAVVRESILENPLDLFTRATTTSADEAIAPELHATAGPIDVSAPIEIEVVSVTESTIDDRPATKVALSWHATRAAALFPTMEATLAMYPLTPTETQLELVGTYTPPLGAIGALVDSVAMDDVAKSSVQHFIDDLAAYLRA